ncbi:hypothetical protein PPTG_16890 [Phytophthora nicotianae INRA-310]|uniref:Ubiquitin-like protease family profile domain-containing protein n=2 Tax=Phytophthora nicotianae TaxID=4792 RepID=W2PMH9_PHYN3|nr:hypothetical protein PPTG_16890 [Phytophthora nicotianae INRA-310]ETN01801.1 hypothetical protein PPTG_16890 [Phytophthora nicotianae INRA-310]
MLGVTVDGHVAASTGLIRAEPSGLTNQKVPIPLNCNGNHWCSNMLTLGTCEAYIYDSSPSSYLLGIRAVAQTLINLLPREVDEGFRVRNYESGLGVQTDSYNCGIYVLLAFEMFCGAEPLDLLDKKTLQCMRYRYLLQRQKMKGLVIKVAGCLQI